MLNGIKLQMLFTVRKKNTAVISMSLLLSNEIKLRSPSSFGIYIACVQNRPALSLSVPKAFLKEKRVIQSQFSYQYKN